MHIYIYIIVAVPCDFTFVDIQSSFGHVSHASLGFLGGKGVEVVNKRRFVGDLKVPNAAVTLRNTRSRLKVSLWIEWLETKTFTTLHRAAHLSTQIHYAGVGVIEGQQNSITGVHLLNTYRLVHVFLEAQNSGFEVWKMFELYDSLPVIWVQ